MTQIPGGYIAGRCCGTATHFLPELCVMLRLSEATADLLSSFIWTVRGDAASCGQDAFRGFASC